MDDTSGAAVAYFHGTRAELPVGALVSAGRRSNYRSDVVMNHVYFTELVAGAGLAAELAVELAGTGTPHVYRVVPTGPFEDDPNVTDKKFPGNPTRSFRSREPVRVVEELLDFPRLDEASLQMWRERLVDVPEDQRGEILN